MKAVVIASVPAGHTPLVTVTELLDQELRASGYDSIERFVVEASKLGFCQGEFDCWVKTPGRCKIHDTEQAITAAIPGADALVLVGPTQFGGYNHALKRAVDRLICLITPFFEQRNALTHHEPRYQRYPALYAIGWLPRHDPGQARTFAELNDANAINLCAPARGSVVLDGEHPELYRSLVRRALETRVEPGARIVDRARLRRELLEAAAPEARAEYSAPKTAALLVGSAKPKGTSASACIAAAYQRKLAASGIRCELHEATEFVHEGQTALAAAESIARAQLFLLVTPLYVDSLPSLVTHALELVAQARRSEDGPAAFFPFINCGFPEAEHIRTALRITRHFAETAQYRFAGGLPLGGGGVVTPEQSLDDERPPVTHVVRAIGLSAAALANGEPVPAAALEAILRPSLPGFLYELIAALGFRWQAHQKGTAQRELRARPFS
jgi:NAD(P)H-dependent FMN reductase